MICYVKTYNVRAWTNLKILQIFHFILAMVSRLLIDVFSYFLGMSDLLNSVLSLSQAVRGTFIGMIVGSLFHIQRLLIRPLTFLAVRV